MLLLYTQGIGCNCDYRKVKVCFKSSKLFCSVALKVVNYFALMPLEICSSIEQALRYHVSLISEVQEYNNRKSCWETNDAYRVTFRIVQVSPLSSNSKRYCKMFEVTEVRASSILWQICSCFNRLLCDNRSRGVEMSRNWFRVSVFLR